MPVDQKDLITWKVSSAYFEGEMSSSVFESLQFHQETFQISTWTGELAIRQEIG